MKIPFSENVNSFAFLIGALLFIYLVLRVFIMPISIDEYTSVNVHASMSWWDILTTGQPNIVWAPNNHVLNTLFIKLEWMIFGKKDWAVRLHILAAFVICFYYATKTIKLFTSSKIHQGLFLLILFLNPYLLDFFGIARGYALSIAGFTVAFYYFMMYTEDFSLKHLWYAFIGLFISVWSNFSALYLMALMVMLMCLEIYRNRKKIKVNRHILTVCMACLSIGLIIIVSLAKTIRSGESTGGKTGLFQDCIVTYIHQFIHHNPHINRHAVFTSGWKYIEVAGVVLFALWTILHFISYFVKTNVRISKMQMYSLVLVIGVAIMTKILFLLFAIPFPAERTELLFSIPFYLGVCIAFERIISGARWGIIPLVSITLLLIWHFFSSITFDNTMEWWQTGDAKRVVRYLREDLKEKERGKPMTIGIETWQYPSLAFYTEEEFKDVLITQWTDLSIDQHYDYLFVSTEKTAMVWTGYELVKKFKYGTLYRLVNKE